MIKKLRDIKVQCQRLLGDYLVLPPNIYQYKKEVVQKRKKVLIVGVVLGDRKNHYKHISSELSGSKFHEVQQVWTVLKAKNKLKSSESIKHTYIDEFVSRSKLINSMINEHLNGCYDYILIIDDDIRLPKRFLDQFLLRQEEFNFSLAQPARTQESIISHKITLQNNSLLARETRFVEIGPLVSIRRDAQNIILPIDEESPMGWGLDYVWPALILENKQKMGIIDCVPVAHTLRETGKSYDTDKAKEEMNKFLALKPHLSEIEAHTILKEFI